MEISCLSVLFLEIFEVQLLASDSCIFASISGEINQFYLSSDYFATSSLDSAY